MFPEASKCFFFSKHVARNPHHRNRIRKSDLDDSRCRMYDRIVNAEELLFQACIGTQAIDADQATRGSIAGMLNGFIRPYWFGGAGYRND